MKYQYKSADLYSVVQTIGADAKEHGDELQFKYCPYCHGGTHKDQYTFSVNIETGVFNCLRESCGEKGHFLKLASDFGIQLWKEEPQYRQYVGRLSFADEWDSTPEAMRYLHEKRGLDATTTAFCRVTTVQNNPSVLVFPFFDEYGHRQTTKFRNTQFQKGSKGSKEWFEENTKPILYGMWLWHDFSKPLVITEGQIDAMSLMQAGINNVVSVPNGANAFTWVEYCREWVEKFPEIIVFGDCEHGKITLVDKIDENFPDIPLKAVQKSKYLSCKDANEMLISLSIYSGNTIDCKPAYKALREAVETAKDVRISSAVRSYDIDWMDFTPPPTIRSGFPSIDKATRGFEESSLVILTGYTGKGKSNLANMFAIHAINSGNKTLIYSGEISNAKIMKQLALMVLGKERIAQTVDPITNNYYNHPKPHMAEIAQEWFYDRLFLWNDETLATDETDSEKKERFIKNLIRSIQILKVKFVILDNLMTLTAFSGGEDKNLYNIQTEFIKRLKEIADSLKVVILLVAHPKKNQFGTKTEIQIDDISGTANVGNVCSVALAFEEVPETDPKYAEGFRRKITVLKNREYGFLKLGKDGIYVKFCSISKRIWESENVAQPDGTVAEFACIPDFIKEYPPTVQMLNALQPPF